MNTLTSLNLSKSHYQYFSGIEYYYSNGG